MVGTENCWIGGYILLCTDNAKLVRFIDKVFRIILGRDARRGWRLPLIDPKARVSSDMLQ